MATERPPPRLPRRLTLADSLVVAAMVSMCVLASAAALLTDLRHVCPAWFYDVASDDLGRRTILYGLPGLALAALCASLVVRARTP